MAGEKRERGTAPKPSTATGSARIGEIGRAEERSSAFGQLAQRAARSSCTILVTGETGVGKGHLAKELHRESPRGDAPFVPVNCGAIPESIIDSQLFGHAQGAFSGATKDHVGLVRAAEGGTLFLDEVGELPASAQTRLLRLLQDREVQPVGHARPLTVDVRIIAATNRDLREAVEQRAFREDLLFRLDVVRIHVPPLRERAAELDALLDQFNREFAELYRQQTLEFDPAARERIHAYRWPGNIRQLRTLVERLHVLCPDEPVTIDRLAEVGHAAEPAPGAARSLDEVRYEEVIRVLGDNGGSVAAVAAVFGVHRSTIYRWLQGRRPTNQP
ncbi:MAG: sigma-54-dependent Fis family transcriptional regulator [Phycisphaerales bacterium]|nr:sigma 54-interacting transcriptional regulator [Phycisphaerae bacterium]NNF42047.1 sigma-54-dependent Fis family transcriptional regulator [Phycisphaerales bacterium]NNM25644.1 sigma-54-dependent Fis family transcriptional regulator [Phycisphaerales bacterium]